MINPYLESIFWSLLPISELRGGIPLAVYRGINIYYAFIICIIANYFIIPLVFFFLDNFHEKFKENKFYNKLFTKYIEKKKNSIEKHIGTKWEFFALILLVAIPLPITGAYTGTLLSWIFGIPRKRAHLALTIGIVISGIIVSVVVFFGIRTLNIFIKTI